MYLVRLWESSVAYSENRRLVLSTSLSMNKFYNLDALSTTSSTKSYTRNFFKVHE